MPPVRLTRKRPALAASTQMIPYARPASTMEERQALTLHGNPKPVPSTAVQNPLAADSNRRRCNSIGT